MKLYKPFEILFCTIETIWDWTGVGGYYQSVSGLIATFQWINFLVVISLINKEIRFLYLGAIYVGFIIFNWVYFKDSRINEILMEYKNHSRQSKVNFAIISLIYFIVSFVLLFLTFGKK